MLRNTTFLAALALLLLPGLCRANLYPVSFEERVRQSSLLAEGVVESQRSFWNKEHTMIFTSSRVHITKLFKGGTGLSSFEVLSAGGTVDNYSIQASHLLQLSPGDAGVFCAFPNSLGLQDPQSGALLYDLWGSAQGFLQYDAARHSAGAPFDHFEDIRMDLYPKLTAATGTDYRIVDPRFTLAGPVANKTTGSILSFSPASLRAGNVDVETNNLLTINGSGFGTRGALSAVLFAHGDYAPGNMSVAVEGLYNNLIKSWTDTKIEVRVPSKAATGQFSVRDNTGTIVATSGTQLNVEFSVLTASFGSGSSAGDPIRTYEYNLMNTNGAGGYSVEYSTSTSGGGANFFAGPAKATFQRALSTWGTLAGYNVADNNVGTAINTVSVGDGHNVVMYDNTGNGVGVLPAGVLAVCYSGGALCSGGNPNDGYQVTGFDIVVRSGASSGTSTAFTTGPCPPTTAEYDLESVLLHELGHAIGQGHINDALEGAGTFPNSNPAKVMHFALTNGLKRVSPDAAALAGSTYLVSGLPAHSYPACGGTFTQQLVPLPTSFDALDACPGAFPGSNPVAGTSISVNHALATSNENADPQFNVLHASGIGTGVTNTVFYPILTNASTGTMLRINVSGYNSLQAACGNGGVELALYQLSACPGGQSYPLPVATRTFHANGDLSDITGLSANTNYLLVMDGIANSFSSYVMSFGGSTALPIGILSFRGAAAKSGNHLEWAIAKTDVLSQLVLERSIDGNSFTAIADFSGPALNPEAGFDDNGAPALAYYRLKVAGQAGEITYSNVVALRRSSGSSYAIAQAGPARPLQIMANGEQAEEVRALLLDAAGREVWSGTCGIPAGQSRQTIALPTVAPGLYLFQLRNAQGTALAAQKVSL